MTITAPVHWFTPHDKNKNYGGVIVDYIERMYPFVTILEVRDTGDVNQYEGATLKYLYQACLDRDIVVLYFHSKGIYSHSIPTSIWRKLLNHHVVERWGECYSIIQQDHIDVVGIRDKVNLDHHVSGNFWWSKSSYITTLPNPLQSQLYQPGRPEFWPNHKDYRYSFEDWLWYHHPRVHHMINTNADHYNDVLYNPREIDFSNETLSESKVHS